MARLLGNRAARPLQLPRCVRDHMMHSGPEIRVVTHGGIRSHGRRDLTDDPIVVASGTTLAEVLASLGIDLGIVGVAAEDGKIVQLDAVLQTDGVIHIYPIFGGG